MQLDSNHLAKMTFSLTDISLSLESAVKQAAAIQNEFKQANETTSKIKQRKYFE